MIWKYHYWKCELLTIARRLNARRWRSCGERALSHSEKDLLIGFYAIRKLIEAKKVSNALMELSIDVKCYPCINPPVTLINRHKIDELYDLTQECTEVRKAEWISNQFIHSYVLMFGTNDNSNYLEGFYCASDRMRNTKIYYFPAKTITKIFQRFGSNYPSRIHCRFNQKSQDFDTFSE